MLTPCKKICELVEGHCIGCGRSIQELRQWTHLEPSMQQHLMDHLPARVAWMSYTALDTFEHPQGHLTLRRLTADDAGSVLVHLKGLSAEDRHTRFGHFMQDQALEDWVHGLTWTQDLMFGLFLNTLENPEESTLVAWSMAQRCAWEPLKAEWGVSVSAQMRGQRLASRLLDQTLRAMKTCDEVYQLVIWTSSTCTPILSMIRAHGGQIRMEDGQAIGTIEGPIKTPESTQGPQVNSGLRGGLSFTSVLARLRR